MKKLRRFLVYPALQSPKSFPTFCPFPVVGAYEFRSDGRDNAKCTKNTNNFLRFWPVSRERSIAWPASVLDSKLALAIQQTNSSPASNKSSGLGTFVSFNCFYLPHHLFISHQESRQLQPSSRRTVTQYKKTRTHSIPCWKWQLCWC